MRFLDVKELDAHDLTLMFDQRRQKQAKLVFDCLLASNLLRKVDQLRMTGLFCRHTGEVGQPSPTPCFYSPIQHSQILHDPPNVTVSLMFVDCLRPELRREVGFLETNVYYLIWLFTHLTTFLW